LAHTAARRFSLPLALALASGLLQTLGCAPARADLVGALNEARARGCGGRPGVTQPLKSSAKLNDAARRMQGGKSLRAALAEVDYHAVSSSSIRLSGWLTDSAVARVFSNRFCESLGAAQLREIGVFSKGRAMWFVLAQPFSALALRDAAAVNRRVVELVNEARSHARRCGSESFAPAGPLRYSAALQRAALAHSRDMAAHDYFEHESPGGGTPAQRVTAQGYKWRVTGENLAAGVTTPEAAVQGWLDSPHHCANLMDPRFTETGAAYAIEPASRLGIYWTQVFALPGR
jgi:uncharacterized protein YkwD